MIISDFVFHNLTTDRKYNGGFFEKIVEFAAKELDLESKKFELSLSLVGEGRIKALNKKYRGKNKTTDVLSFPLMERGPIRSRAGQELITSNGVNDIISLGDIFICLPVAKKNAAREKVSLDYIMSFLTIHGFMHLLGYDHEKSAIEKDKMFTLQDKILKRLATSD
ncbi:MAG: rRNA maturation RNase YbeY [Candidatus Yanofskybacteria bacterium]|nr:rRNA maturation RNase YbeY [Candidatus Yanofskybacteria bacterium]